MKKKEKERKSPRSKISTKSKPLNEDSWRAEIESVSINDDQWWCIVAMMVETNIEYAKCVELFNDYAVDGKRKAIYSLSYQKMLAAVKTLSKQSLEKCPAIQGICHYASKVLSEESDPLPIWLMARVIKYLIHRAREESIGIMKRLTELEREIDEEYWIMQNVADWGQPKSKGFDLERFNNKANTRLRKRNEEWRDAIFISDAPLNGPNLYVILTGFHDPDLPEALIDAGVPLICIAPIKSPSDRLYPFVKQEILEHSMPARQSVFGSYVCNSLEIFTFWATIHNRSMNPESHPTFCDIGFPSFCSPMLPQTFDSHEYERQRKEIYDRISYFLYDLYDLYREHADYLKSMKVEKNIVDTEEKCNQKIYETLLESVPPERVSVPLILFAMSMQIEFNETKVLNRELTDVDEAKKSEKRASEDRKSEGMDPSVDAFVKQKLSELNVKFDLTKETDDEQDVTDIELILHGDALSETIHLLDDSANFPLTSFDPNDISTIFWHPRIMGLHSMHKIPKKRLQEYCHHIDKTLQYFDSQTSNEEVKHYLHILIFDRLIFGKYQSVTPKDIREANIANAMNLHNSLDSMTRSKSVPSLTSRFKQEIHFYSDSNIDYNKMVLKLIECSPLFDLIDPRELLAPGYLEENVFRTRVNEKLNLQEFDDLELLSKPVFLQTVHHCLLLFDRFVALYFEPTDSVLLCFSNEWRINDVQKTKRMSNIRTPVCFRDFCEYVVAEEEDWIRRQEKLYRLQTTESIGRLMKKVEEIYDETLLFRDEDFILPGSLKARDLQRANDSAKRIEDSDIDVRELINVDVYGFNMLPCKKNVAKYGEDCTLKFTVSLFNIEPNTYAESGATSEKTSRASKKRKAEKEKSQKKEGKSSDRKTATKEKKSDAEKGSPSSLERSSIVDGDENGAPYEFIGYDLGRLRVQVTNRVKTFFSADGTLVRVEMDDWLYKNKDLRVTVAIGDNNLRLFRRIAGREETSQLFHVSTKRGIILSFEKLFETQRNAWSRSVDFRASWPSGLMIEPILGDETENPFYIRQSYISKSYNGTREVCRKFLRNGTVLKYLPNGEIIVLRPNGAIVTCTAFEKLQHSEHVMPINQTNNPKGENGNRLAKEPKAPLKSKRKPGSLKSQLPGMVEKDPMFAQQDSTTGVGSVSSIMDTVKVSRYTVLNHDGQWYEVADDLVVSEHHRLLVRTASDYEVDEKFTRRADGTDMLLKSNGELIVGFPDVDPP
ncbi:uncharacterized protein LOC143185082 [Calliopsis andreniformis]|uniref:uncharacterized protein LOC143185082 n=1 Tax=Calliopsis andreniformis TaxID=337506 RepID=UPI003FCCC34C